jgi:hypothetical protein
LRSFFAYVKVVSHHRLAGRKRWFELTIRPVFVSYHNITYAHTLLGAITCRLYHKQCLMARLRHEGIAWTPANTIPCGRKPRQTLFHFGLVSDFKVRSASRLIPAAAARAWQIGERQTHFPQR